MVSCNPIPGMNVIEEIFASKSLSVDSVTPSSGFILGGTTITMTGAGFKTDTTVNIGSTPCGSVVVNSSTQLTCTVPSVSSPTVANISLINSGTTTITTATYEYKSDAFTKIELFSGNLSWSGSSDGVSTTAKFYHPSKPLVLGSYIYISDTDSHTIRRMNINTQAVETVAGLASVSGTTNGIGSAARFDTPMGMTAVGTDIYIVENNSCVIRKLDTLTQAVTLIAGVNYDCDTPTNNSVGLFATFSFPTSIANDGTYLYVGDLSRTIRRISLSPPHSVDDLQFDINPMFALDILRVGTTIYFLDANEQSSTTDLISVDISAPSPQTTVYLSSLPQKSAGITTDGTDLYITAPQNHTIRKFNIASGTLTTVAGTGTFGNTDGTGTSASMFVPAGVDFANGNIYFTSLGSHNLRSYNVSSTVVTTLAGNNK